MDYFIKLCLSKWDGKAKVVSRFIHFPSSQHLYSLNFALFCANGMIISVLVQIQFSSALLI